MASHYNAQAIGDARVLRAKDEIKSIYDHNIDVGSRSKSMLKFGSTAFADTSITTIQSQGGNEVYATTNAIDKVSSSEDTDTGTIVIEGYTIAAGLLTFVTQEVTMVGETETAIGTPLARVTRAYNASTAAWDGDVYIYQDDTVTAGVPQTAGKIHMKILIGDEQSQKCASSTAQDEYLLITRMHGSVWSAAAAFTDFTLEVRQVAATNKPFRNVGGGSTSRGGGGIIVDYDPLYIIPPNHDWRIRVLSTATSKAYASFHGILASVV